MPDRPYRVLVTGPRNVTPEQAVFVRATLTVITLPVLRQGWDVTIVQGRCPTGGVDRVAEKWADNARGVKSEPVPADWEHLGRRAGPIRNAEMVGRGAAICVGFPDPTADPDHSGTWDCIRKAVAAGIHVRLYPLTVPR